MKHAVPFVQATALNVLLQQYAQGVKLYTILKMTHAVLFAQVTALNVHL